MPYSDPDARRAAKRDSARRRRARLAAAEVGPDVTDLVKHGETSDVVAAVTFRYPARDGGGREEWQLAGVNLGPRGTGPLASTAC